MVIGYTKCGQYLDHELRHTEEEQDAGVIIDSKRELDKHIHHQINKASSIVAYHIKVKNVYTVR